MAFSTSGEMPLLLLLLLPLLLLITIIISSIKTAPVVDGLLHVGRDAVGALVEHRKRRPVEEEPRKGCRRHTTLQNQSII